MLDVVFTTPSGRPRRPDPSDTSRPASWSAVEVWWQEILPPTLCTPPPERCWEADVRLALSMSEWSSVPVHPALAWGEGGWARWERRPAAEDA